MKSRAFQSGKSVRQGEYTSLLERCIRKQRKSFRDTLILVP